MLLFWILFNVFVLAMLALDLGVFNRRATRQIPRSGRSGRCVWIALALAFAVIVFFWHGRTESLEFVTGYVIELSLSVDNLFVFLLIFRYFRVPPSDQHKVLFWGIVGALLMRAVFILLGVTLIQRFHWMVYVFGAFLVYSGIKLISDEDKEIQPEKNPLLRLLRRFIPVTDTYEEGKFFIRRPKLYATPLLVVLMVIETTDLIFATDSIPAVLAITLNAFIVYTSNIFAILGLRSMYFALAGMMEIFHYLHYGLSLVLIFIGGKMLVSHFYEISTPVSLAVVAGLLLASVGASLAFPKKTPS